MILFYYRGKKKRKETALYYDYLLIGFGKYVFSLVIFYSFTIY